MAIGANNAPTFFFNALVEVTSRIENINPPGDCLGTNAFTPIRQSAYPRQFDPRWLANRLLRPALRYLRRPELDAREVPRGVAPASGSGFA